MRTPDPWDARPPFTAELSRSELREFLEVAGRNPAAFNDWQISFCSDVRARLKWAELTPGQARILNSGLLRRLWLNDPDLWD